MKLQLALIAATLLASFSAYADYDYPTARKENAAIWKHGVRIYDPYAWMENDHDLELQQWIRDQNTFVDTALSSTLRESLVADFQRIEALREAKGEKSRFDFDHSIEREHLWRQKIAPVANAEESLKSADERYKIEQISDYKSDIKVIRIKDTENDTYLGDVLQAKFASFYWEDGNESFIYSSDRDSRLGDSRPIIRRHILGTTQVQDEELFVAPEPDTWIGLRKVGDRFLMTVENREYVKIGFFDPATRTFTESFTQGTTTILPMGIDEDKLLQVTYENEDKGQYVSRDINTGATSVLIEASDLPMTSVMKKGDKHYVTYIDNAANRIFVHDLAAKTSEEIRLPGPGTAKISKTDEEIKVSYVTYAEKSSSWLLNQETNVLEMETAAEELPFALTAQRVFYRAHDGREAPIWLVHRADLELSSTSPVYMYGYGGFAINIMPRFRDNYLPWYERGGVIAFVTLPGGMEFGRKWMEDGQLFQKRNVFDDFAAAGRRLIQLNYTSRDTLAIGGGSNGGLLVGATANLYPNLFKAAVPEVGVMDLVNFQRFTGGKWWQTDYGNREVRNEFLLQLQLSPYHQIRKRRYPATLVIPADHDDRVVPSHGYRFAARLQELNMGPNPIFLHTRINSSHGFTGTASERVRYEANRWTFLMQQLGLSN